MWKKIAEQIAQVTVEKFEVINHSSVGGGWINIVGLVGCVNGM